MKGHKLCGWLKVGETENCGKNCIGVYCKVHLARIHRKSTIPVPCGLAVRVFKTRFISVRPVVGKGFATIIKFCRNLPRFGLIKLRPNFWVLKHPFKGKLRDWCTHLTTWMQTLTTCLNSGLEKGQNPFKRDNKLSTKSRLMTTMTTSSKRCLEKGQNPFTRVNNSSTPSRISIVSDTLPTAPS